MTKILGQKIKEVRQMSAEELENIGWGYVVDHNIPDMIVLENDVKIIPCQDPELNGPGFFARPSISLIGRTYNAFRSTHTIFIDDLPIKCWRDPERNGSGYILYQDPETQEYFEIS